MAIVNISGTINSSFSTSGVLVNAAQSAGDAIFTIDLRPTNPIIIVQDNLDYGPLLWDINDVVAVITLVGPQGDIYRNEDYNAPDIVPATSRYLNKTVTMPLDPLTDYTNILKGNYTLKISWYNSNLDEYYTFLKTYQYNIDPAIIANTTVSGPYTGVLKSTDTTEYGNDVHQIIREHRIQYPTQLAVPPPDVVSSNAEVQVTPIYTNEWNIIISSFVEYRMVDELRVYWEGSGEFTHCVYGGCIGAMWDAINTMLETYKDAMACNLNNQEDYQKRLVIVNTAWHLLNEAYWEGYTDLADEQAYVIQEQVEYTGAGTCGGATSELVVPCPPWTGGGVGGVYTFSNALVEAAGNVTWGGSLVQATTVLMVGHEVLFSGSDAGNTVSQSISAAGGVVTKAGDGSTEGHVHILSTGLILDYNDLGTPANSRIYNIGSSGLVEASDYSAGYGNLSLVSKLYVDTLFSGSASYTFENGLTATAGVVKLGGALNELTTIDATNFDFRVRTSNDINRSNELLVTEGNMMMSAYGTSDWTNTNNYGRVQVTAGYVTFAWKVVGGANDFKAFQITDSIMEIRDDVHLKGLENRADYSAAWTDHSLVTKKWVTDNFAAGTLITAFTGLSDTPNDYTGFGGYFVTVNPGATALQFVAAAFVPATGGTFTGQVTIATTTDRPLIIQQIGAGSNPGTPEGGTNLIAFQDNDGDEQGYIGIDASGNIVFGSNVTGAGILVDDDLEVNGDLIITGVVDGVDIAAWKTSYDIKEVQWDEAYGWGDHAGLYQILDADLTAIAALGFTTTAFLTKTAAETWVLDTNVYATLDYVNSLALTYIFPPEVLDVVYSDGYTGTVTDVQTLDGNSIQVEERVADPGFEIRFEYIDVTSFNNVFLYLYYHGGATHEILIQLYNYDTLDWDTIGTFTDQTGFTIIDIPVALSADYIDVGDESTLRLYHNGTGNIAHYIEVDYAVLRLLPQLGGGGGVTDHGGLTGLSDDDHPQYAFADGSRAVYYIPSGSKQSSVDAGTFGETSLDDDYLYVCVQTGSAGSAIWKQTAILQSP